MLPYHTPLTVAQLRALAIPAPWAFGQTDRTRFGEIDALNHVNNTAYLRWFESLRLPYLKSRQVSDYGPEGPRLVLAEIGCRFLAEMGINQDYVVTARTRTFRTSSFVMDYAVWAMDAGEPEAPAILTAEAHAGIVLRTQDGDSKFPIPDAARRLFAELDGAEAL